MADHLGSTRLVTNADGTVGGRHDYLPFGEEIGTSYGGRSSIPGYGVTDLRHKFTAKERDPESNLDYFGARYFSGAQGRFTSADPSRRSSVLTNPQTWNKYSYVLNQPFRYVDQNGKWPTAIHNLIVDLAFPGLSSRQRDAIKAGSFRIDNIVLGGQLASRSYQHSMTAPGQSSAEAQAATRAFVSDQTRVAAKQQLFYEQTGRDGVSTFALGLFGEAFHPVTDENSPMHEWQEWAGLGDHVDLLLAALHTLGEASITASELGQAVDAARNLYRTTFGADRLNQAIRSDDSLYFYRIWTNAFADKLIRTEPRPKRRKKGPEEHVTVDLRYED
ncbi:MAG: RHS repeat-associated core domain-containing protein [Acidobacteriota bacterium]